MNKILSFDYNGGKMEMNHREIATRFNMVGLRFKDEDIKNPDILESFMFNRDVQILDKETREVLQEGKAGGHLVLGLTDFNLISDEEFQETYVRDQPRRIGNIVFLKDEKFGESLANQQIADIINNMEEPEEVVEGGSENE